VSSVCARLLLLGPLLLVSATSDFPTQSRVGDRVLALNGEGVRTYSWLGVEIYRAALYLNLS
jgi:hypothetical protein